MTAPLAVDWRVGLAALFVALALLPTAGVSAADDKAVMTREQYLGNDATWREHMALVGRKAPRLSLDDWRVRQLRGRDIKGKILVLDFWATWCGGCIAAIPHNNELAEAFAEDGVEVIGVCGDGGVRAMTALVEQHDVQYPSAYADRATVRAWRVSFWPTYAVIDRDGFVRGVGLRSSAVGELVREVLAEQPWEPESRAAIDDAPGDAS
ncbi:MAG: TlpA disulfide reductase family protein [Planctomycetota bacterium]